MAPEFTPPDPDEIPKPRSVTINDRIWRRLREIGREQKPRKSRPEVLQLFLDWAIRGYDLAQQRKKK